VVKFEDVGDTTADKIAWMAEHVTARYPDPLPVTATAQEIVEHTDYVEKITQFMTHKCYAKEAGGCEDKYGVCVRGYGSFVITTENSFNLKGFPLYARHTIDDLTVVAHNRQILLDWDGHCNVEACSSGYVVLYLYKYLYKGNKKITIHLDNVSDLHADDEHMHHIRGRMLCSMECAYRILGYQMYPPSMPTVTRIKVQTEVEMTDIVERGQMSDMAVYLSRPKNALFQNMLYAEFYHLWMYAKKHPVNFTVLQHNELPHTHAATAREEGDDDDVDFDGDDDEVCKQLYPCYHALKLPFFSIFF
jgi:hypothetical protein